MKQYKNFLGYTYLKYIKENYSLPFKLGKIYGETADVFGVSPKSIDRAIGFYIKKIDSNMTPSEFIAEMLDTKE